VLRSRTPTAAWWLAARYRHDAPVYVSGLLAGRTRVEVTASEAAAALAWAETVDGWSTADPKPIYLYRPAASD
jgi:hypothetical protein